ncbi:MAG TPA: ABC transporter substrate-binding protein [Candidatus Binataceae bacterium]|nr:ABC transporter substrate-binding protein [Candidatus Binataceae bacterium]
MNRPANDHAKEQVLYLGQASDPRTFNPILVTDNTSQEIVGNMFESLIDLNEETVLPGPRLAQSWDISADQKTITFHLRHDVQWFDGQPLTAKDVLFTMKVIYDPKVPNSYRPSLLVDGKPIVSEAPDDYTVVMHVPKPFAPLLYSIGVPVIPEHVLGGPYAAGQFNHTWGIDTPPDKLVGDSAYRLVRYVPAQVEQFTRNPSFWMKDEHGGQLPRLHGRMMLIVPDINAMYLRFLDGETDIYSPRPKDVFDLQSKAQSLDISVNKAGVENGTLFFVFNRNPRHYVKNGVTDPKLNWFTDLNFLRAVAHAVDKKTIISLCYHGLGEPAIGDISPANKVFFDPNLKDYDYDLKLAAQMLEAAGYHLVNGERFDPKGNRIEFNLTTNAENGERQQMCAILQQDLEKLGMKVDYRPLEFTTLVDKLDTTFDWDCVMIGFTGTPDPNGGSNVYRSSGNLHMWNPSEPKPATPWEAEIDRLLDQGDSEMDPQKRVPYYWRIQEILHDQLPMIEVVRQVGYSAWKNSIENYQPTVWGAYKSEWIQFKQ